MCNRQFFIALVAMIFLPFVGRAAVQTKSMDKHHVSAKKRLEALNTRAPREVMLLDSITSEKDKRVYTWNEYGHLTSSLFYVRQGNKWMPACDTDNDDDRIYEYDYDGQGNCTRMSEFRVNRDGTKAEEIYRYTVETLDGLQVYTSYEEQDDALQISSQMGYDKWGNLALLKEYSYSGELEEEFRATFTCCVTRENEYGEPEFIRGYRTYALDYYNWEYGSINYAFRTEVESTDRRVTHKRYEYDSFSECYELEWQKDTLWTSAARDRYEQITYTEWNELVAGHPSSTRSGDISVETFTQRFEYDDLRRLVKIIEEKMVDDEQRFCYTSTISYYNDDVYDPFRPRYFYAGKKRVLNASDEDWALMQAYNRVEENTFGPVAQCRIERQKPRRGGEYYSEPREITCIYTFDGKARPSGAIIQDSDNSWYGTATRTYSYNADGALDYTITTWSDNDIQERRVFTTEADGTVASAKDYYRYSSSEAWEENDDDDEDDYYYDDDHYYAPKHAPGEWFSRRDGDWFIEGEEGYRMTRMFEGRYRPYSSPIDFVGGYYLDAFPYGYDELWSVVSVSYREEYRWDEEKGKFRLESAYGSYPVQDGNKVIYHSYYYDAYSSDTYYYSDGTTFDFVLTPSSITEVTIDAQNREVKRESDGGSSVVSYTYLDDTLLLLSKTIKNGESVSIWTYHYSDHLLADALECIPATVNTADGAKTYNLQGQEVGTDYKGIVVRDGKKFLRK